MADFYGTVEDADAYHTARGNAAWGQASVADKIAALIRASSWLDGTYGARYPGKRTAGRTQTLGWPRTGAIDCEGDTLAVDEIPVEIENATYEAALRELAAPGSLSPDYVAAERVIREKVGELEVEYSDKFNASSILPVFTVIDGILGCLIKGKGSLMTSFVQRA